MKVLRKGDRGPTVRRWQTFLLGRGFDPKGCDGIFGTDTEMATKSFQQAQRLPATGVVDNMTLGRAAMLGFAIAVDRTDDPAGPNFPPPPPFKPVLSTEGREGLFGAFRYRHQPLPTDYEHIQILDGWQKENIVSVALPQLASIRRPARTSVLFHRLAQRQLAELWSAWERAGLVGRIITWDGGFNPRYQRGSTTKLSNHAFGSAFDINAKWKPLGSIPALFDEEGSVRELVRIGNDHGFYWGGHFSGRPDGMHFEIAAVR